MILNIIELYFSSTVLVVNGLLTIREGNLTHFLQYFVICVSKCVIMITGILRDNSLQQYQRISVNVSFSS
jgi:hypothetical protein